MPSINVEENAENGDKEAPSSKPIVGIIYPPPDVRNIVDKTAHFVARNGPEFEARIRQSEANDRKFNFLNPGDPYNAYYQHKVKEIKEGKTATPSLPPKQLEVLKTVEPALLIKDPPADYEFTADPPSISAFDLDVVKLTAQFVARNGRQFLTNLMNREQRNYQFDFLRPQHSLFNYFTKLLEQYTKVLIPSKDLQSRMKREAVDLKPVLEEIRYRVQWTRFQEAQRKREEEIAERERAAYAQVDWHDFVIVEAVDYQSHEHGYFPPPTTPEEIGARVLAQERYEDLGQDVEMEVDSDHETGNSEAEIPGVSKTNEDDTQVQDMEEDSDEDDEPGKGKKPEKEPAPVLPPPPLPPVPDQVIIRKDYDPKAQKTVRAAPVNDYLISPITGERIPASKIQEHMRIGMLDPRWVEQRNQTIQGKIQHEDVYAQDSAIESSLKLLAERRTDIFGVGDEETAIGKKIGEEDKVSDEKVTWDGYMSSMEAATRAARANITIEEQIHQIHKVKGLLPDEEKERIGPSKPLKPSAATIIAQATTTAPAKRAAPQVPMPPVVGPPTIAMQLMPPQAMMAQNMMMVPQMPPVGPPPMPPPPLMTHMAPGRHFPIPPQIHQMMEEDPPAKKQKTEDSLINEQMFLRKNKSPVMFKVQVPNITDKQEWKLNGQVLFITLPLTDMVSVIKAKIHQETSMPPGKQKLLYDGMFFKDSNTLAYYNVVPNSIVQLQLKERGGRKK
uniref:Splicing factor 3A subunit 1 n=1 Tax=Strigamia maritima TaxID=126957 RepID=T1JKU4_STRMM